MGRIFTVLLVALSFACLTANAGAAVGFDFDADGVTDANEAVYGSDPSKVDTDGDGLADGIENADLNGERSSGETDATKSDTDSDGLADGAEDANRNGAVDRGESSPILADSDSDDILDGVDNCRLDRNSRQSDWDFDGRGDVCDRDVDLTLNLRTEKGNMLSIAKIGGRHFFRAKPGKVIVMRGSVVPKESDGEITVRVQYRSCRKGCSYKTLKPVAVKRREGSRYVKGYRVWRRGGYLFTALIDEGSNNDRSLSVVKRVWVR